MATELWLLMGAIGIGIVHLSIVSFVLKRDVGNAWTLGPRDETPEGISPLWGRMKRAHENFLESFPLFAAAVLICAVIDGFGPLSVWGAHLYVWARVAYIPAYAIGIPWTRTIIWQVSMVGLILILAELVW